MAPLPGVIDNMGLLRAWKGTVTFDGRDVTRLSPHEKAALGLVLVPEGRQLFSTMRSSAITAPKRKLLDHKERISRANRTFGKAGQ